MADSSVFNPLFVARPTTYRGIKMRSRLEATWAAYFDEAGWAWEYEPECFAAGRYQYLPDFLAETDGGPCYFEVKGWLEDPAPVMARMEVIFATNPEARLLLLVGKPDDAWYSPRHHWESECSDGVVTWYEGDETIAAAVQHRDAVPSRSVRVV